MEQIGLKETPAGKQEGKQRPQEFGASVISLKWRKM
jgi:hypothetical protein